MLLKKNILFFIFLIIKRSVSNPLQSCPTYKFFLVGMKVFCEDSKGLSVSCSESSQIQKAYLHCEVGYKSEQKISNQIIECNKNNGEWSEEPMKCSPECVSYPTTLALISKKNLKFPNSYAEFVRKEKRDGKSNKYPGIIITERRILTKEKFLDNENFDDFIIRIYKSPTDYIEHTFFSWICDINDNKKFDTLCIVYIPDTDYIRYNEKTRPACEKSLTDKPEFGYTLFTSLKFDYKNYIVPDIDGPCYVPGVNENQVELRCYDTLPFHFKPIKCSSRAQIVTKKCQIGYANDKLTTKDNIFSRCISNHWTNYADDNDCKKICGSLDLNARENNKLSFRGHRTDIKHAPWHAGVFANNTDYSTSFEQICGASIIHTDILISAAHCFWDSATGKPYHESNFLIGTGKTYRSYDVPDKYEHYARVSEIHVPSNYQDSPVQNDIAVVIIDHHLKFSPYIKPICIQWKEYNEYRNFENVEGFLVGWGSTSREDVSSTELMRINLTTISNRDCKRKVEPNFKNEVTNDKFCATNEKQSAACRGDSGGGFAILKESRYPDVDRYYLAGVISVGLDSNKYCSEGFITLFQNIQYSQNFIKQVISSHRDWKYGSG